MARPPCVVFYGESSIKISACASYALFVPDGNESSPERVWQAERAPRAARDVRLLRFRYGGHKIGWSANRKLRELGHEIEEQLRVPIGFAQGKLSAALRSGKRESLWRRERVGEGNPPVGGDSEPGDV